MACFIVPGAEAAVVTIANKVIEKKVPAEKAGSVTFAGKLKWLTNLQLGGAALLAFEHVWHGEVAPWFPFLTAMSSADSASEMFHEMSTVGVGMAAMTTAAWAVMVLVAKAIEKRTDNEAVTE